jgi:hypothetical protein
MLASEPWWRRVLRVLPLGAVAHVGACAIIPAATLPAPQTDGLLKDAVLLSLTTRSTDGLLGRAWSTERRRPDPVRRVVEGEPRHEVTHQHIEVLRRVDMLAQVGALGPGFGVSASGSAQTDVAYSVDITGYDTLDAQPSAYGTASGCCVNGTVAAACDGGYVRRALRGSGRLRFLRRLSAGASASAGPVLRAEGGASYELLDETTFEDAYFALFVEPLVDVCAHVAPDQEISPIRVVASDNCTVRIYSTAGTQRARSSYYPSADACWIASERACAEAAEPLVACPATFHEGDGSVVVRDLIPRSTGAAVAAEGPAAPVPGVAAAGARRQVAPPPVAGSAPAGAPRAGPAVAR